MSPLPRPLSPVQSYDDHLTPLHGMSVLLHLKVFRLLHAPNAFTFGDPVTS